MQIWAGFCTRPQLLSFYIPHISQNRPQEVHVCTLEAGFLLVFDFRQGVFDILDADGLGDIAHMGKKFAFRLERQNTGTQNGRHGILRNPPGQRCAAGVSPTGIQINGALIGLIIADLVGDILGFQEIQNLGIPGLCRFPKAHAQNARVVQVISPQGTYILSLLFSFLSAVANRSKVPARAMPIPARSISRTPDFSICPPAKFPAEQPRE